MEDTFDSARFGGPEWHEPRNDLAALCSWFKSEGWIERIEYSASGSELYRVFVHTDYQDGIAPVPLIYLFRDKYLVTAGYAYVHMGMWRDLTKRDIRYWRHHDRMIPENPPNELIIRNDRYLIKVAGPKGQVLNEGAIADVTPQDLYEQCYPVAFRIQMIVDQFNLSYKIEADSLQYYPEGGADQRKHYLLNRKDNEERRKRLTTELLQLLPWLAEAADMVRRVFSARAEIALVPDAETAIFKFGDNLYKVRLSGSDPYEFKVERIYSGRLSELIHTLTDAGADLALTARVLRDTLDRYAHLRDDPNWECLDLGFHFQAERAALESKRSAVSKPLGVGPFRYAAEWDSIRDVVQQCNNFRRRLPVVALYASAGNDTRALSFMHPQYLNKHVNEDIIAPNIFVYVDTSYALAKLQDGTVEARIDYRDEYTVIETIADRELTICGWPSRVSRVWWKSYLQPDRSSDRSSWVVFIRAPNREVFHQCRHELWAPDFFVGVTDGCRMGGNDTCVNELSNRQVSLLQSSVLPQYWITDHFQNFKLVDSNGCETKQSRIGETVESSEPSFPVNFRKLALLSSDWGRYGRGDVFGGATLFRVETRT